MLMLSVILDGDVRSRLRVEEVLEAVTAATAFENDK